MADLFDAIEEVESGIVNQGFLEGSCKKQTETQQIGFDIGWKQSCHIIREFSIIKGFLQSILLNGCPIDDKTLKLINKVIESIDKYFTEKPVEEKELESNLFKVHLKSKQILKNLNISSQILEQLLESSF